MEYKKNKIKTHRPLISIITIVFNCKDTIESTIQSVLSQNMIDVEYIIIDGNSNDGTIDIIKKYEPFIDVILSEDDTGIYDAMNKGIRASTGTWLNFMNSGDIFFNNQVLKNICFNNYYNTSILYGNSYDQAQVNKPYPLKALEHGIIMASHQAMFFNRDIIKDQIFYNCNYKIYADYDLVNRVHGVGFKFKYINQCISIREPNGVSSKVTWTKRFDKLRIVFKAYGITGIINAYIFKDIS